MRAAPHRLLYICILLCLCLPARATHIVGGEATYTYKGNGIYEITLIIYEDCLNGTKSAIISDDPAYISIYDGLDTLIYFDAIHYASSLPVPANFSNACITNVPDICLLKKTFIADYYLPPNATGYTFAYQRCCRNAALVNVQSPAFTGATYYCTIPPATVADTNSSAVFTYYPPQIICVNTPLIYNNSATDADGDSLSYELCNSISADNDNTPQNSAPLPPPYANVAYVSPPYSYAYPLTAYPALEIDPKTGIITGTPNRVGRYLVTVCCNEWRNGIIINTIRREFQFVVTNCSKVVVADIPVLTSYPNTYALNCVSHTISFLNTSKGGNTWDWNFGVPDIGTDTAFQPAFTYPDTGTFTVKLIVNPGSTCTDSVVRSVRVYPAFYAAFADSGDLCPSSPINFADRTISTVQPITYRKWVFGDGDSSSLQNPVHAYQRSGIYNAILLTQNAEGCTDTALRQVMIDNFAPFAGRDTVIVKGEKIQFYATGGTQYTWSPPAYLSETDTYNPMGYYPDTGRFTYYVHISSPFGCAGTDTIQVTVVNQAEFFVPTAFSPNGDGRNDLFRPVAAGYSALGYFRVYNRWGQLVYNNTSLETGWDGTFNNKLCETGAYFWQITFTDRFGKTGFLKGDVTLVR